MTDPANDKQRFFAIGLPQTGTTNLHAAAVMLGFSAIHYPLQLTPRWVRGDFSEQALGRFEFYSDLPIPIYYREFDRTCPNSRFILTIRDPESWLDSNERWFNASPPSSPRTAQRDLVRLISYGIKGFHRQRFLDIYRRHVDEALNYFSSRPSDLLTLDLATEKEPWTALCSFLERDVPQDPFPYLKTPAIGNLSFVLPEEVIDKRYRMMRLAEKSRQSGAA